MKFQTPLLVLSALTIAACGGEKAAAPTGPKAPPTLNAPAPTPVKAEMSAMDRGKIMFKRCRACHTLGQGEKNKVGPNLWAIYGAQAGAKEFNYSKALLAKDIVWTAETMDEYIKKPSAYIPGGRMSFVGLKKQEDRDALQVYLRAETGAETSAPDTP